MNGLPEMRLILRTQKALHNVVSAMCAMGFLAAYKPWHYTC